MSKIVILLLSLLMSLSLFSKTTKMGGSDTGGGSGFLNEDQLILKDFKNCQINNSLLNLSPGKEVITDSISKINSLDIANMIEGLQKFESPIFEKVLSMAASRANFYLVDTHLESSSPNKLKLAIYKRPLGIIIDRNLFSSLSTINQQGLLFHEALRMLSIGFNIPISESDVENLTCQAFSLSTKKIELKSYPELNNFITNWIAFYDKDSLTIPEIRLNILTELESAKYLNDIDFPLLNNSKNNFLYQGYTSKFENLRNFIPESSKERLDEAFFNWAQREVPANCTSEYECDYYEEWPADSNILISRFIKWKLFYNDSRMSGWRDENNKIVYVSKYSDPNFCQNLENELQMKLNYKAIDEKIGLEFLIDRDNLDYFNLIAPEYSKTQFCIR